MDILNAFKKREGVIFDNSNNSTNKVSDTLKGAYIDFIKPEYVHFLDAHINVYEDHELLPYLNSSDMVTINEEIFETLSSMLESTDSENHILAMEIMSNCNYVGSLLYLGLLFNKFGYGSISSSRTKNHVNFKSLVTYLDNPYLFSGSSSFGVDEIVDLLIAKNELTKDKLDVILKHLASELIGEEVVRPTDKTTYWSSGKGNSKYFKTKTITISDKINDLLNEDFQFPLIDTYTPKEIIVEELVEESIETLSIDELTSQDEVVEF